MEVIWQSEADDPAEAAIRLIMDDNGCIMFQYSSLDFPEWTDVDEVPVHFNLPSEARLQLYSTPLSYDSVTQSMGFAWPESGMTR